MISFKNDYDKIFFYVNALILFIAFPVKFFLLNSLGEWFDVSNDIALNNMALMGPAAKVQVFLFSAALCIAYLACLFWGLKILPSRTHNERAFHSPGSVALVFSFGVTAVLLWMISYLKLFHVGVMGVEPLPFKLYGQLKMLALFVPTFFIYFFIYRRGYVKISLLCLILLSVYNLGISGSKFSLIVPILTYIFLTKANRISLVPIFGIVLFYSFFNVFAFRDYIVANSDGYNLFRAVEFAFEQNIGFVRILGGLHVIVDRIPGVEVIINTLGSSVSGYSDMNHVYNMVILGRYFGESSSATSLLGFLTLRFGMFYVFVALPVFVFIFLLIRRLLERFIYNEELRFLSAAAFYVMFIGMLVDGNLQLLATYVAPFYLYILSVLYCQARRVLYVR